ncbi:MAG: hypothetical protein ACLFQK_00395 [Fibrobacterota bacterium]
MFNTGIKNPERGSVTARAIDVIGDGREEILVVRGKQLFIFMNTDDVPGRIPSPWNDYEYSVRKYINHPAGL